MDQRYLPFSCFLHTSSCSKSFTNSFCRHLKSRDFFYKSLTYRVNITRKSVDGEPSHIPALIKANRIEASYFLAYVAKYG